VPFDAGEALIHTRNEAVFLARHCAAMGYGAVLVRLRRLFSAARPSGAIPPLPF